MKSIGLDFGTGFFKAIVLDEHNSIIHFSYSKYTGLLFDEAIKFIEKVGELFPNEKFHVGITSLNSIKKVEESIYVNDIIATASGVKIFYPDAMSIIEIGSETSKFINLTKGEISGLSDFAVNTHCAAGTGSFIEQQAKRLNMTPEELSSASIMAKNCARIAGRCSVFAKSDMIHLQQKGTPVEEIAYGLCMAIARNAMNTLLLGRDILVPVVLAGGCAKNMGILRAFSELLKLNDKKIIASSIAGLEGGVGAAIKARKRNSSVFSPDEIKELLKVALSEKTEESKTILKKISPRRNEFYREPSEVFREQQRGFIGIDVGSVSTDIVVINEQGKVLSAIYLPTAGNPIKALQDGLREISLRFKGGLRVEGCGTTGSGRYLAARLAGADLIKNEITCQMLGATFFFPDADTIFEIGGQDSKFISIENGQIKDFTMNKICAAGTGSFIEEQASQLGINVYREFTELASASTNPPNFSSNCTVYMESELSSSLKKGMQKEDACAGIAYAIAKNYLEKVAGRKRIGNKIVFQGGVASNGAVVSAFKNILGKEIFVHPYNRISGAIGAAIAVVQKKPNKSSFRGFEINVDSRPETFECRACSNYCEVTRVITRNEKIFFGDVCEKFTSSGGTAGANGLPDLSAEYLESCRAMFARKRDSKISVGIPAASFFLAYLPFWGKFFYELGITPVLSSPTSEKTITSGSKYLPATTCAPVKIAIGHIAELIESGVDFVFFPTIVSLPDENKKSRAAVCPLTLSIPFLFNKPTSRIFSPELSMNGDESDFLKSLSVFLNSNYFRVDEAYQKAKEYYHKFKKRLQEKGGQLLNSHPGVKFIVLGRPYNIYDSYLNMNLFAHLRKLNILAIPYNYIKVPGDNISTFIPWKFPSDNFKILREILSHEDVYPLLLSNYGCGPDGITQRMAEEILESRPYLMLEFDEHRGEAGLITRLEAFADLIEKNKNHKTSGKTSVYLPQLEVNEIKQHKIYIPYFADHARAMSGALKFAGYSAELLPPPDNETKELGTSAATGKECHAYAMLLGDLLKLTKSKDEKFYYCFTGTNIPCLLNQFHNSMNHTLDKEIREKITAIAPKTEDFFKMIKIDGCTKLYEGMLAIEILLRLRCRYKPYEVEKGITQKIYDECLNEIENAVAEGDVLKGFRESLKKFSKLRLANAGIKPKIGIAGDIYTRINSFANDDLFNYLEENGFEIIPAPFEIDIVDFGIEKEFYTAIEKKRILKALPSGFFYLRKSLVRKKFLSILSSFQLPVTPDDFTEPDYREANILACNYFQNKDGELVLLNIAKILDFIRKGAKGIINAMCLNCMVGSSSQAIIEKIKKDKKVPIISLTYSASETQSQLMLLDAFMEHVRRYS